MRYEDAVTFATLKQSRAYLPRVRALSGLIAFWPMDDAGTTIRDRGPNGLTGTYKGTIAAKPIVWAGGRYADYTTGFGDVYSAGLLSAFDPNAFSINLYAKPDAWTSAADQYLVHWYADAGNYIRLHVTTGGSLTYTWKAGGVVETVTVGAACWPSDWIMLTITANKASNRIRLLLNSEYNVFGADTAGGTWAGSFGSNTCGFAGYRGSSFTLSYAGGLSDIAVYNREISEAEARTLLVHPLPVLAGIGDSILQYTSRSSWIQGVAQTRGYRVVNHGVSGTSIMGAVNGMDAQTLAAANDGASIIILQHGINDANDAGITAKYGANIAALKLSNPNATIYGMGILNNTSATAAYRDTNNARIQAACVAQSVTYWNTDGWITPATDTDDGVHPNTSGAAKIVTQILARL